MTFAEWYEYANRIRLERESFDGFWVSEITPWNNPNGERLTVDQINLLVAVFRANFAKKYVTRGELNYSDARNLASGVPFAQQQSGPDFYGSSGDRYFRELDVALLNYLRTNTVPEDFEQWRLWGKSRSGNMWAEVGTELGKIAGLGAAVVGFVVAAPAVVSAASAPAAGGAASVPAGVGGGFTLPTLPAGAKVAVTGAIGSLGDELKKRAEAEIEKLKSGEKKEEPIQVSVGEVALPIAKSVGSKALLFSPLLLLLFL